MAVIFCYVLYQCIINAYIYWKRVSNVIYFKDVSLSIVGSVRRRLFFSMRTLGVFAHRLTNKHAVHNHGIYPRSNPGNVTSILEIR